MKAKPIRLIMAVNLIVGIVFIALCLVCSWLTAFRGTLWTVPAGLVFAAVGSYFIEDFCRLVKYLQWRNKQ